VSSLVDSDVLIDYLAGRGDAVALMHRREPDWEGLNPISFAEVFEGIYRDPDSRAREREFRIVLRRMSVFAVTRNVALRGARIRGDLRARGLPLPLTDVLIAATAIERELTLVTRSLRHDQRIPGLTLYQQSSLPT
jgi:tRNA(fMet)-specific endonuclease VapC